MLDAAKTFLFRGSDKNPVANETCRSVAMKGIKAEDDQLVRSLLMDQNFRAIAIIDFASQGIRPARTNRMSRKPAFSKSCPMS